MSGIQHGFYKQSETCKLKEAVILFRRYPFNFAPGGELRT